MFRYYKKNYYQPYFETVVTKSRCCKCKISCDFSKCLLLFFFLPSACAPGTKRDIFVLMEGSSFVGESNFNIMLNFVKEVVKALTISPTDVLVSLATFGSTEDTFIYLKDNQNKADLVGAIDAMSFRGGSVNL